MRILLSLLLCLVGLAHAADTPVVRVEVSPAAVTVGESLRLRVTVLVPTWFPRPPRYPSFEITNAVVRLPADSSFPMSERIDGETWSGIVRNYEVIPLIAGNFELDDLMMQVAYANPETIKPVVVNVAVPPVAFAAAVPPGAESLAPYIAGTGLELRRELDRETADLAVGDALVVNYIAELDGLPSMFIPEFLPGVDQPGVSIYAAQPEYSDDPRASRSEKLTYVFAAGGEFEIPGAELDWWNTESSTIETTRLPAMSVRVTGPPAAVSPAEDAQRQMHPQRFAAILLLALAAGWALRHISAVIRRRRAKRKQQILASEAYAFGQLQQALAAGDAHLSYSRMLEWLARLHAGLDATAFVDRYGDVSLQQGLAELRGDLYAGTQRQPDLRAFAGSLSKARKVYKLEEQRAGANLLPELNP